MLLSMTGFGEANCQSGTRLCHVEMKSVNNRHFKLTYRCPDGLARYEPELERLLRETISRGTVQLTIRLSREATAPSALINRTLLKSYWQQLRDVGDELGAPPQDITALLTLPGVVDDGELDEDTAKQIWSGIETAVGQALQKLQEFRRKEGEAMVADLRQHGASIAQQVDAVAARGPHLIAEYRDRLLVRVQELLGTANVQLDANDVIREVSLFADRSDVNEEITRLRSHLDQMTALFSTPGSQGRKLEFLCQEMFREANTIGSKSNDVGVAHAAVNIKTSIERIKEIVANVE